MDVKEMKKYLIPLLLLVAVFLGGCSHQTTLKQTLVSDGGQWKIEAGNGIPTNYFYFYDDDTFTKVSGQHVPITEGTYELSKEDEQLSLVTRKKDTVYRNIKQIDDKTLTMDHGGKSITLVKVHEEN